MVGLFGRTTEVRKMGGGGKEGGREGRMGVYVYCRYWCLRLSHFSYHPLPPSLPPSLPPFLKQFLSALLPLTAPATRTDVITSVLQPFLVFAER